MVEAGWTAFLRRHPDGQFRCQSRGVQMMVDVATGLTKEIFCDQENWIVILRRQDGSVDFYRDWGQYAAGFGDLQGEFWFGMEDLYKLTSFHGYELMFDLMDWDDVMLSATYTNFSVASAADNYRLHVEFVEGAANDSLTDQNGSGFSTRDRDNDIHTKSCAEKLSGAWWYTKCTSANLFGVYKNSSEAPAKDGLSWKYWHGTQYSLKFVQMKIRPV
ncbi:ficolin-2-like [Babylonia areolata]|uniref:ficolin-2-like n=1 Tax=Babylonia areolata TaxID=304850 RepID=UPI003FCFE09B